MENNKITTEKIIEIFEETDSKWEGDNALQGLNLLAKYADHDVLIGTGYEKIHSIGFDEAIKNGITEDDLKKLALLNWSASEEYECFSCFV